MAIMADNYKNNLIFRSFLTLEYRKYFIFIIPCDAHKNSAIMKMHDG